MSIFTAGELSGKRGRVFRNKFGRVVSISNIVTEPILDSQRIEYTVEEPLIEKGDKYTLFFRGNLWDFFLNYDDVTQYYVNASQGHLDLTLAKALILHTFGYVTDSSGNLVRVREPFSGTATIAAVHPVEGEDDTFSVEKAYAKNVRERAYVSDANTDSQLYPPYPNEDGIYD